MWWDQNLLALFRRNLWTTVTYWSVFFSFGLCIAFLGPTILDLRCLTHSSLKEITWVFFAQQFCILVGSTLGGAFKKSLKLCLFVLLTSTLIISVVFVIIPFCRHVVVLAVIMAVAGLSMGCIDTISNMQLVKIYKQDSAVFLQVLHFFVGFGALLSPLIVDPFLSDTNCIQSNYTLNGSTNLEHIRNSIVPHHPGNVSHYVLPLYGPALTNVGYAFWIMASINLPVPIAVFILMYKAGMVPGCEDRNGTLLSADELAMETHKGHQTSDSQITETQKVQSGNFNCCQNKTFWDAPCTYFAIHICSALILFMTDGIVGEYSGFVYSYAVEEPLLLAHKTAGYLPSVLWASVTLGRLISISVSYTMAPRTMLLINMIGVLGAFLFLILSQNSTAGLFIGTAFLGLFISSVFPSMLAYTENILNYKGCATTVLVTSAGIGEMVLQILVGTIIETKGSYSFLVCGVSLSTLAFTLYIVLVVLDNMHTRESKDTPWKTPEQGRDAEPYQR
ncbi:PREDICTED: major facilitator superfamily domain-containing protein 4A [Nanorana parkeri]|uniref:major facilitator superfamily domain-containing protein 4A n=1 Tax=Nanorana parkeri TaxID=125878 RepID=UPI000854F901|nr:PREDICTED: major facilitator superfamily domain-containing protein 4A [Nanorana parkeri]